MRPFRKPTGKPNWRSNHDRTWVRASVRPRLGARGLKTFWARCRARWAARTIYQFAHHTSYLKPGEQPVTTNPLPPGADGPTFFKKRKTGTEDCHLPRSGSERTCPQTRLSFSTAGASSAESRARVLPMYEQADHLSWLVRWKKRFRLASWESLPSRLRAAAAAAEPRPVAAA